MTRLTLHDPAGNFSEPHRSAFIKLIRQGAGAIDVVGQEHADEASERFIERELDRPREHLRNICHYIRHLKPGHVLDLGCGTGGLTVALCAAFRGVPVVGIDAVPITIEAARVRAAGCGAQAQFQVVPQDTQLPFADGSFDLVTCTSVLEFVTDPSARARLASEMIRVGRRDILLTTPNPLARIRELHTGRWLGDFRRHPEFPWACTPSEMDRLFMPFRRTALPERVRDKFKAAAMPVWLTQVVEVVMPWQFILYSKPKSRSTLMH